MHSPRGRVHPMTVCRCRLHRHATSHVCEPVLLTHMLSSTEVLFWVCLFLGLYPYVGYPLCVGLLRLFRPRPVHARAITPSVTVVISAHNEAATIEATVRNKLEQDYPPAQLDVLVASDGSDDGTDAILRRLAHEEPRVSFFRQQPRNGKTAALNSLIERSGAE